MAGVSLPGADGRAQRSGVQPDARIHDCRVPAQRAGANAVGDRRGMSALEKRIAENLARVRERIQSATAASGRAADAITLVAVTKYASADMASAVAHAGCLDLAE